MTTDVFALLQLADATFPSGGFAHSGGLEAAVQLGEVRGSASLRGFVEVAIRQVGRGALPFVTSAHARVDAWAAIDARCELFLRNHVQNRASRDQGRALLEATSRAFEAVRPILAEGRARRLAMHHAPVFGAAFATLGQGRAATQSAFLHGALRGLLSAAVRLGVVGPLEAQRLHADLVPVLSSVVAACGALEADDVAQTAPTHDVLAGAHERLYVRLFQS